MRYTERVRRHYDRNAGSYDRIISWAEKALFGGGREWVCSQAREEVLEIAVGTGRNLPFYPEDARLTGVELSPKMLDLARRRAGELGRDADLRVGDAQNLPFPNASFDRVVATLALCTIPDDRRAVIEAARVLRPGGRLLLLEHVRSSVLPVRLLQHALEPLTLLIDHDHLLREPLRHVENAGLAVENLERSKWGIVERLPLANHRRCIFPVIGRKRLTQHVAAEKDGPGAATKRRPRISVKLRAGARPVLAFSGIVSLSLLTESIFVPLLPPRGF